MSTDTEAPKTRTQQLMGLLTARITAKRAEDAAIARRRDIDEQIVSLLPAKKEGSVTEKVNDELKITATFQVTRKADDAAIKRDWATLPDAVKAAFPASHDVAVKELKALTGGDAATAAKYFTSKPGSTSLKLEVA